MSIITSQNWDGVSAGSIPSGWTLSTGLTVAAGAFASSPNALASTGAQGSGTFYATYATADGNGGNAVASADFAFNGLTSQKWGLFGRSSLSPPNLSTAVYHELRLEYVNVDKIWGLTLYKVDHGSTTTLLALEIGSFSASAWYTATLSMVGSTLTGTLQRKSDGYCLNAAGLWQSSAAVAISVTDSTLTSAGYWGVVLTSTASGIAYSDNFELDTAIAQADATASASALSGSGRLALATTTFDRAFSVSALAAAAVLSTASASIASASLSASLSGSAGLSAAVSTIIATAAPSSLAVISGQGAASLITSSALATSPVLATATLPSAQAGMAIDVQAIVLTVTGSLTASSQTTEAILSGLILNGSGTLTSAAALGFAIVSASDFFGGVGLGVSLTAFGSTAAAGPWSGSGNLPPAASIDRGWTQAVAPFVAAGFAPIISLQTQGNQDVGSSSVVAGSADLGVPSIWFNVPGGIVYNVYANDGNGGPIDHDAPVATTSALVWTSGPLAGPGNWKFGVRALRLDDGLEEKNLDAAIELMLDASAVDVSRRPASPTGLRVIPRAAGMVRVEWGYHVTDRPRAPLGFRVYAGLGDVPDASAPVASVPYVQGRTSYLADLTGLAPGARYAIGVRAFNASGEEPNTLAFAIVPDATGPGGVDSLQAAPTDTEGG